MFYTEDDLHPVVNVTERVFGKNNTYLHGNDVTHSITVATKEYGKIWHGDIYTENLDGNCKMLANLLQRDIYILHHGNQLVNSSPDRLDFNNSICYPYQAN